MLFITFSTLILNFNFLLFEFKFLILEFILSGVIIFIGLFNNLNLSFVLYALSPNNIKYLDLLLIFVISFIELLIVFTS